eukprot:gb/GECH01012361.1/.p1 GENE.gb/GECH01012361.1/~~gb/GECH01012361.1/.p1  ORF type:complete len:368 (+),score=115.20 gb/GECH01012361.1/:1-1104(+)
MQTETLSIESNIIPLSGRCLTSQEKNSLLHGLPILKHENKFHKLFYFGKVITVSNNYHLSCGFGENMLEEPSIFYSIDNGLKWTLLNEPPKEQESLVEKIRCMFTGDPAYQYEISVPLQDQQESESENDQGSIEENQDTQENQNDEEEKEQDKTENNEDNNHEEEDEQKEEDEGDNDDDDNDDDNDDGENGTDNGINEENDQENEEEEDKQQENSKEKKKPLNKIEKVTEEVRLSCFIRDMLQNTFVIPRGLLQKMSKDEAKYNPLFNGLNVEDSKKLEYYFHLRPAKDALSEKTESYSESIDFMDSINQDLPSGCWSITSDPSYGIVLGRSLLYPGYNFYSVPNSTVCGSFYIGYGEKKRDLCFMI